MLKKIVKYGNSNALVLDRAILALLNIEEGATVKLRTDGTSLIITPTEHTKNQTVTMTGQEMISHTMQANWQKQQEVIKADPKKNKEFEKWKPGSESFLKLTKAFKKITEKYHDDIEKLNNKDFLDAIDKLAEKYNGDKSSPLFIQEFMELRAQFVPNLVNMDKEMLEARKKLGMPDYL